MIRLVDVEVRRCLARRLTWVLIGLGLLASAVAGIVVFAQNEKQTAAVIAAREAQREADVASCVQSFRRPSPDGSFSVEGPDGGITVGGPEVRAPSQEDAEQICQQFGQASGDDELRLTDLWDADGGDAVLLVTATFLGIGALLGGASMVGAEWKAGTFTTMLTWEPRRVRVAVAKILAAGVLAVVVAIALQLVFAAALLPAFLLKGTTEGADAAWLRTAAAGVGRSGLLAGAAAVAGASIAMIGRNTSAALGAAFAYLAVGEAVIRAWKPKLGRWLIGENAAIFLTGDRLESVTFERGLGMAALTLAGLATAAVGLAALSLERRDVAG